MPRLRPWEATSRRTKALFYLVTSVRKGVVDDHKLFAWEPAQKKFVEIPMAIVG